MAMATSMTKGDTRKLPLPFLGISVLQPDRLVPLLTDADHVVYRVVHGPGMFNSLACGQFVYRRGNFCRRMYEESILRNELQSGLPNFEQIEKEEQFLVR